MSLSWPTFIKSTHSNDLDLPDNHILFVENNSQKFRTLLRTVELCRHSCYTGLHHPYPTTPVLVVVRVGQVIQSRLKVSKTTLKTRARTMKSSPEETRQANTEDERDNPILNILFSQTWCPFIWKLELIVCRYFCIAKKRCNSLHSTSAGRNLCVFTTLEVEMILGGSWHYDTKFIFTNFSVMQSSSTRMRFI